MTIIPKVDVPCDKRGDWEVSQFIIHDKSSVALMRLNMAGRGIEPGTYTQLTRRGRVIMSDTPAERRDHSYFVARSEGRVLITGLGLGMVANACLLNERVIRVDVIEIDRDVIGLVAPHWQDKWGDRFNIIHADALAWKPTKDQRWDSAWHDIWPAICGDNLPEMHRLHRKFGRRVSGYHASWCRYECERGR